MRLDALLSRYGYCSRREAPGWIKRHSVTSGGSACANPADKVQAEDVLIDGEPVEFPEGLYAALHKPAGYTCSHDEEEGDVIYDLLPFQWRHRNPAVSSVGRLDKETSGLLLITDDGKFIHRMTSPRHHVPKVYEVRVKHALTAAQLDRLLAGVVLDDDPKPVRAAACQAVRDFDLTLTLTEGKYHQVKRMVAAVGNRVEGLHRSRMGELALDPALAPGQWRWLTEAEVAALTRKAPAPAATR